MPIFEYQCKDCNTKFDILHKSINNIDKIKCPKCQSENTKKLLSTFSATINGSNSSNYSNSSCATGSCGIPSYGGCANGMCGI
ncbi:MAG TPA: zinc ribbon domain-containing protein [Melioribacteraceae bacterium]|nr:zinc ribbon domain-containing protein [Melioribacteraceae bacterium]